MMDELRELDIAYKQTGDKYSIGSELISIEFSISNKGIGLIGLKGQKEFSYINMQRDDFFFDYGIYEAFKLKKAQAVKVNVGGRPVLKMSIELQSKSTECTLFVEAFPNSPVIRLWYEIKNITNNELKLSESMAYNLAFNSGFMNGCTNYWMIGDNNRNNSLSFDSAKVEIGYHIFLKSQKQSNYIPWMCFQAQNDTKDTCSIWLDYTGNWEMDVTDNKNEFSYKATFFSDRGILPDEVFISPYITILAFCGDFDNMMTSIYNWQYTYLWDYTNDKYYAKTKYLAPWYYAANNLQENYASRVGKLDFDTVKSTEIAGAEVLWHDAGWSEGTLYEPSQEGPDFSHTIKYLEKKGMTFIVWFALHPQLWLLNSKIGAWGDFQWRTDGLGELNYSRDNEMRKRIKGFLDENPQASFHTCDGGSKYAHTFEINRFSDANYLSDIGNGDHTNYYLSYWETPDKWFDIADFWMERGHYNPALSGGRLALVPGWGYVASPESLLKVRRTIEIYKYLKQEGVAGRWSYTFHPRVEGDDEKYYSQRTSYDRKKGCIVFKHCTTSFGFTIYPKGLLDDYVYTINLESRRNGAKVFVNWTDNIGMKEERSGKDLMENGIFLSAQCLYTGEVIYLGLPNRPEIGNDKVTPQSPGKVLARIESNSGHIGVGIYWSAGTDNNWLRGYEIKRNETIIAQVNFGCFYFDSEIGFDEKAHYCVRSVDGDNNKSEWASSEKIENENLCYHSLGCHSKIAGENGLYAEYSNDNGNSYLPMEWIEPAYSTAGDFGGRGDQPGGVEGYWQSNCGAVVGRGWQQPSQNSIVSRTFVAPKDGEVIITGRAMKEYYRQSLGDGIKVDITKNKESIWEKNGSKIAKPFDLYGEEHQIKTELRKGDTIRFIAYSGTSYENDIVAWMPSITYTENIVRNKKTTFRINCGGKAITDSLQNKWSTDDFCLIEHEKTTVTYNTKGKEEIFNTNRVGKDFEYVIPVEVGLYTIRLSFKESEYDFDYERPFNVEINNQKKECNFDINHEGHRNSEIVQKIYPYMVPDEDGKIKIRLSGGFDANQKSYEALINGIEILPQANETIRVNCGCKENYIDWNSNVWKADNSYAGENEEINSDLPVSQAMPTIYDQKLYQSARTGKLISYKFKLSSAFYTVHVKLAELWNTNEGRVLCFEINGKIYKKDYNAQKLEDSKGKAMDISFKGICPDSSGEINLNIYCNNGENAILQAIEIF